MNKNTFVMLLVCVGMVKSVCAEAAAIYQVADMAGNTEYQILSKEEFAKLSTEIKEEQKVMAAVVTAAKKEWEADKTNKMPFPASKIKARMVKKLSQDFPNRDVASERLATIEERAAKKMEEDKKEKGNRGSRGKSDPEDAAKEALKQTMANSAIADVNRRMAEKLGREVPMYGFVATTAKKAAPAKAAPAKDAKKEEPKKDEAKKDDAKKEPEKKPAH
jgi:ribosomal protein L17